MWEKKKTLVTSIFSFSRNVFYPFCYKFQFFDHIYFAVDIKCYINLDQSTILSFGEELNGNIPTFCETGFTTSLELYINGHLRDHKDWRILSLRLFALDYHVSHPRFVLCLLPCFFLWPTPKLCFTQFDFKYQVPSPIVQSVALRTWEQEVAGSIPDSANILLRGLMIVIANGFFPLSPLSVVSTMVMWESSQWLGKNIVRSTG